MKIPGGFACGVFAVAVLWACATEPPPLVTDPGVSLAGRTNLVVATASNETGKTFDYDFTDTFTDDLKSSLREKGYTITGAKAAPPDALLIQCSFLSYSPGNAAARVVGAGTTEARVKTTVIDKKTGEVVGDLLTTKQVGGGFPLLCPICAAAVVTTTVGEYETILKGVADDVATAIDRSIKGD